MIKAGVVVLFVALFAASATLSNIHAQEIPLTLFSLGNTQKLNCPDLSPPLLSFNFYGECPFVPQIQSEVLQKSDTYKRPEISFNLEESFAPSTPSPITQPPQIPDTPSPSENISPPSPSTPPINDNADVIFNLINEHRQAIGKPPFQKNPALCQLAQVRSTEIQGEIAKGTLHSGLYNRHLPYWITEDAKYGSNEQGTFNWWMHSPIHREAIENNDTYSCVACTGTYCSALFTNYTPK